MKETIKNLMIEILFIQVSLIMFQKKATNKILVALNIIKNIKKYKSKNQ